jgi:phage minor structural protein
LYTILDANLKPCGILDLNGKGCKFYDDLRSTKIADDQGKIWIDTLELSVPYGYRETAFMTHGYHLLKQGNDGLFYCYRIYSPEDDTIGPVHVKKVKALNLLAWDLAHKIVQAKTMPNATSQDGFGYILQRSGWEIGESDFFGGVRSLEFSAGNNAQYWLDQLTGQFSVEIRAHVQVYNGKIIRKIVDMVEELGESKGRRLEYSHDLVGLTRTGNDSQLYTKLYIYGGTDTKGNIASIATVNGGRDYIVDDDANDLFNNGNDYSEGYIVNDSILNPNGLLSWGKEQMEKWNHPKFNYNVDVGYLGYKPNLGDHFQVVDFSMEPELTISARAIQLDESEANPTNNKVIVGEFIEINAVTPEIIQEMREKAKKAQDTAEQAKNYNIQYFSPDGLDFSEGSALKRIIIRVYLGRDDVTSTIDISQFIWQKINPDGTYDDAWSDSHKDIGNVITLGSEVTGCVVRCKIEDGNLPSVAIYFKNGINYVLDELFNVQTDTTLSVLFITDTHYATSSVNANNLKSRSTMHMQNVSYLTNKAVINAVVHGGDLIDGNEPKKLMMTDLQDAAESLHSYMNAPLLFMVGNHDDNSWYANDKDSNLIRSVIQPSERYNVLKKYLDSGIVQNTNDKESLYYYKDFPTQKIRLICLNSFDNPYMTQSNGTNKYPSQWQSAFRNTQLSWLANTALKLPASGWGVLFFTHAPFQGTFNSETQINSDILYGILNAFINGTSYSGTGNTTDYTCNVSCNYSAQGIGEIIAVISGHVHYDSDMTKNGMKCIQTINSLARNDFAGVMPDRPLVSLLEDAWDVFTIDRSKRKIFATRFGAGSSRVFSY